MESIVCFTSGGSRGNPGPAGIGIVIMEADAVIHEEARSVGNATDTFAEYCAVMTCLQLLKEYLKDDNTTTDVEIKLASEQVQKQLAHESQINEPGLIPMFIEIHNLRVAHFPKLRFTYIPGEENKTAAALVNEVLDKASGRS
jgi:ribonuclease HI